jgi:hypothetical protein
MDVVAAETLTWRPRPPCRSHRLRHCDSGGYESGPPALRLALKHGITCLNTQARSTAITGEVRVILANLGQEPFDG